MVKIKQLFENEMDELTRIQKVLDQVDVDISNLKPGDKQKISVKIVKVENLQDELDKLMDYYRNIELNNPPVWRKTVYNKYNELKSACEEVIEELQKKLNDVESDTALLNSLFKKIDKECSDYIADVKATNKWLYRGSSKSGPIYIEKPHDERKPRDSRIDFSEAFNICLSRLGFKALRNNSMFCTPSYDQASDYISNDGAVFVVFPRNNFLYTYTKKDDIVVDSNEFVNMLNPHAVHDFLIDFKKYRNTIPPKLDQYMFRYDNAMKNFQNPAYSEIDIFLDILSIWTHDHPEDVTFPEIIQLTPKKLADMVDLEDFENKYEPSQDDFVDFLRYRDGEIMIRGIYYCVNTRLLSDEIADFWGVPVLKGGGKTNA